MSANRQEQSQLAKIGKQLGRFFGWYPPREEDTSHPAMQQGTLPYAILQQGHDARAIANIFAVKSYLTDNTLSITQMAKLVYFAHGWTLGYTGLPLIRDPVVISAPRGGPVVPIIYKTFRPQGILIKAPAIDGEGQPYCTKVSPAQGKIISNVYKAYSHMRSLKIVRAPNTADPSWHSGIISNEEIKHYFQKRAQEAKQHAA